MFTAWELNFFVLAYRNIAIYYSITTNTHIHTYITAKKEKKYIENIQEK